MLYSFGSITGNLTNERQSFLSISQPEGLNQVFGYGRTSADISGQKLNSITYNGDANFNFFENGSSVALATSNSAPPGGTSLPFSTSRRPSQFRAVGFRFSNTSAFFNGNFQEIIVYTTNESSNRTGIETNINAYYAIY